MRTSTRMNRLPIPVWERLIGGRRVWGALFVVLGVILD